MMLDLGGVIRNDIDYASRYGRGNYYPHFGGNASSWREGG